MLTLAGAVHGGFDDVGSRIHDRTAASFRGHEGGNGGKSRHGSGKRYAESESSQGLYGNFIGALHNRRTHRYRSPRPPHQAAPTNGTRQNS